MSAGNSCLFSGMGLSTRTPTTGTGLATLSCKYKDWLPGGAETQPRLCFGFGGSDNRGGLHRPPFYFPPRNFPWFDSKVPRSVSPRLVVVLGLSRGVDQNGAFVPAAGVQRMANG